MNVLHTKAYTSLLFILIVLSEAAVSGQEWSIYGCRAFLPDDAPQHRVIELFNLPEVVQNSGFMSTLKEKDCYNKNKPVQFIGYTSKGREPTPKLENEVTLQCRDKSGLQRKGKDSSTLENAAICSDCETYFQVTGGYIVERHVGTFDYSITYTIYDIDDFVIKASGSYPWYLDHDDLVKSMKRNKRTCYIACTSRMNIEVNRRTLEVRTESLDDDGKLISIKWLSCNPSKKKM